MRAWARMLELLFGFGWEVGRTVFVGYVVVSAIPLATPMLLGLGLRPLVDGAVFGRTGDVVPGTVLIGTALVLSVLAPTAYRWVTIRMRELSRMVIQRRLLTFCTRASRIEHFERPEFWDRLQLLKRDAYGFVEGVAVAFVGPLVVAQLVVTAVLLAELNPVLALVPVVAIPAAWLARRAEGLRRNAELRTAEHRRTAQHLFTVASSAAPGKELRLYGLREEVLGRHRAAMREVHRGMEAGLFRSVAVTAGSWLLFCAAFVGAVVVVLREAAAGRATPGDVALTLGLAAAVVAAAVRVSSLAASVLRLRTVAEHYYWLKEQATASVAAGTGVAAPDRLEHGIDLDGVSFTYGDTDRPALSDVSLQLPAGAVVAIVGENGAGKTTLVKLLCGMYAPTRGRITIDGVDLATVDVDSYRERITAGFQDFVRYELLARETVGIGDVDRIDDRPAIREALAKANAGFVDQLPYGLDTQVGPSWRDGVDLSGGEWQKLALSRSLFRDDALLLFLDEPTASLDPPSEHVLFEQIAADSGSGKRDGRITVLISHRFSTVRMADLIVVLDQGRVLERGTHAELVSRGGLYAELYHLQADAYR